jgi:hypothetical protein
MRSDSVAMLVMTVVLLSAGGVWARADEVPNPCKLVSESDVHSTLGVTGPFAMQPAPHAPPIYRARIVEMGSGHLGLAIPTYVGSRKNALVCGGRAGDINVSIGVVALEQGKADEAEDRKEWALLERKGTYKAERTVFGSTTCEETFGPARDLLGRGARPGDFRVSGMGCYTSRDGWQVEIAARPWLPKKEMPFTIGELRALVELAAERLPATRPTAAQNEVTPETSVPAGFMIMR